MRLLRRVTLIVGMSALAWICCRSEVNGAAAATDDACSATPREATQLLLAPRPTSLHAGYRVQDLLIDPVLRKSWIRIASCDDPRRALLLVPLEVQLATTGVGTVLTHKTETVEPTLSEQPQVLTPTSPSVPEVARTLLMKRNAAVQVTFESSAVHMILQGRAMSDAAAGQAVEVSLDRAVEGGQQKYHMHGIAVAPNRVEVRP